MIKTKDKILMIDCETTNTIDDPIVYDVGLEVFDLTGRTYDSASYINSDIFEDENLMATAYYAEKIPIYKEQIEKGESTLLPWNRIKWQVYDICKEHNCKIAVAHNARFDSKSLNYTQRYITTSQYRYFLPYGVVWWDTLKMAKETLKNNPAYRLFCLENGYVTSRNQNRYTAEVIYRFLRNNINFNEAHRGLDDVRIEKEIFRYCVSVKPDIDGRLYTKPYAPKEGAWHKHWWNTGA